MDAERFTYKPVITGDQRRAMKPYGYQPGKKISVVLTQQAALDVTRDGLTNFTGPAGGGRQSRATYPRLERNERQLYEREPRRSGR